MSNYLSIRVVKPSDLNWLFKMENELEIIRITKRDEKLSKDFLKEFIHQSSDFISFEQLRMIIELNKKQIGTIDFFNFNKLKRACEVGIAIFDIKHRKKGYAFQAFEMAEKLAVRYQIDVLLAEFEQHNEASAKLFKKMGFLVLNANEISTYFEENLENTIKSMKCLKK